MTQFRQDEDVATVRGHMPPGAPSVFTRNREMEMRMTRRFAALHRFSLQSLAALSMLAIDIGSACAQSVGLPTPRLLTTSPMGGQVGTTVDVTISGDNLEEVEALRFNHMGLVAQPKTDAAGAPVTNQFAVTIAPDCPPGLYEARVLSRLGISSSRMFSVGTLAEISRTTANTTLETATALPLNTVCNATMTNQAVDHYAIEVPAGQRIVVECAASGIDSKAKPVLVLADALGNDLQVERRGGIIDRTIADAGKYVIKVHDLTFNGGAHHFYRLAARTAVPGEAVARFPATQSVSAVSWPPVGLADAASISEAEPADLSTLNPQPSAPQPITLPCDLGGRFFPAADVDTFEFSAKKGEVWWVEVGSERLGRPTDPALVVQRVTKDGETETLTDVVELSDIPSPVKVSSNGYAYDGPPYNAGSADINGRLEIPEDGVYRLQMTDLFGGTRSDPDNVYRLIVRPAAPDFSIVGWPLHMELRNGDRNALAKPIALRGGATIPYEIVVIRRDGFEGEIELVVENLPPGVAATGLKIAAGKSRGIVLFTADQDAPRGIADATFFGRATINGAVVTRPGRFAEVAFSIPDSWGEVPRPRLVSSIPVSVCGHEFAPLTIAPADGKVWEAKVGEKLTIPLVHTRRSEFSGANLNLRTFGEGFEGHPAFDVPLTAEASEATFDLATLKAAPGEYTLAFYGSPVAKYRDRPDLVTAAEAQLAEAKAAVEAATAEAKSAADAVQAATEDQKAALTAATEAAAARQKAAEAAAAQAEQKLKAASDRAQPKDVVDIVVSSPIRIRVLPVEEAAKP